MMPSMVQAISLADEIEEQSIPTRLDLILSDDERAMIVYALRSHTILKAALRHADEALFWYKGRGFELDGKPAGEVIDAALNEGELVA